MPARSLRPAAKWQVAFLLSAYDTMVLETLEDIRIAKRDVLIDLIESAKEDGQEQFKCVWIMFVFRMMLFIFLERMKLIC